MPTHQIDLRPDGSSQRFVAETGLTVVVGREPYLHTGESELQVQRVGAVQDLDFTDDRGRVLVAFRGGAGLAGGRITIDEREYRLRTSPNPLRPSWTLREARGPIARFVPVRGSLAAGLQVTQLAAPWFAADERLLVPVVAFALLARTTLGSWTSDSGGG